MANTSTSFEYFTLIGLENEINTSHFMIFKYSSNACWPLLTSSPRIPLNFKKHSMVSYQLSICLDMICPHSIRTSKLIRALSVQNQILRVLLKNYPFPNSSIHCCQNIMTRQNQTSEDCLISFLPNGTENGIRNELLKN